MNPDIIQDETTGMRVDHLQIVDDRLKGQGEEMLFKYLNTLITEKEQAI
jgi:hypothetical protein